MQSAEYGPFLRSFKTILAESPHIIHVDFKGGLKAALSAPVTEIATLYHESAPPSDAESNAAKLKEIVDKEAPGTLLGYAYGISHEELEADGKKGKVAVAVIGWPTKEGKCFCVNSTHPTYGSMLELLLIQASSAHVISRHRAL